LHRSLTLIGEAHRFGTSDATRKGGHGAAADLGVGTLLRRLDDQRFDVMSGGVLRARLNV